MMIAILGDDIVNDVAGSRCVCEIGKCGVGDSKT